MYEVFLSLLERDGLTVADVSRATGIGQSTLSNWKARRNLLSAKNAQIIADFFGVSVDYLMTGKETPKESTSGKVYYFSDETAEIAQDIYGNPDLHWLHKNTKKMPPEDLAALKTMVSALLRKEHGEDG